MPIAVTGAGGMLGSELRRQLGDEAVGLDLPDLDLIDAVAVRARLLELSPEGVINTAAFTAVDRAEEQVDDCRRINVEAVTTMAEVCRRLDCPLVQLSTDYVFGADGSRRRPYGEDDLPGPVNAYGRSKLDGEREAATCPRNFIVRTCGLFGNRGPRSAAPDFVARMLELGAHKRRVAVVNDQRCSPSYVPHVAAAIVRLLETTAYGVYHVVNGGDVTWHEFAREIFLQAGMDVTVDPISTAEFGAAARRPAYSVLDTAKYQALAGHALPTWREALTEHLAARGREREKG